MNRRTWLYCGGCLVALLAIGYIVAAARDSHHSAIRTQARGLAELESSLEHVQAGSQREQMIIWEIAVSHVHLSKLYAEIGQTNLSAQHIAEALIYAKKWQGACRITNESELMEGVAAWDRGVVN